MRSHGTGTSLVVAVLALGAALGPARAGTITAPGAPLSLPGFSTGTIGPIGSTPAPNNDNAAASSPNVIPYTIFYNAQGVGILDAEFVVVNSGGVTEYRFTQTLFNITGQTWTGFHFELGFGTGASFVRSGPSDFLDFDTPEGDPAPTASAFTLLNHQTDTLDWSGGAVPSIGVAAFTFAVDVPDNLQSVHPGGLNRFTLRQVQAVSPAAAVPEPSSLLLLGAGLAGIGAARRRQTANED